MNSYNPYDAIDVVSGYCYHTYLNFLSSYLPNIFLFQSIRIGQIDCTNLLYTTPHIIQNYTVLLISTHPHILYAFLILSIVLFCFVSFALDIRSGNIFYFKSIYIYTITIGFSNKGCRFFFFIFEYVISYAGHKGHYSSLLSISFFRESY